MWARDFFKDFFKYSINVKWKTVCTSAPWFRSTPELCGFFLGPYCTNPPSFRRIRPVVFCYPDDKQSHSLNAKHCGLSNFYAFTFKYIHWGAFEQWAQESAKKGDNHSCWPQILNQTKLFESMKRLIISASTLDISWNTFQACWIKHTVHMIGSAT